MVSNYMACKSIIIRQLHNSISFLPLYQLKKKKRDGTSGNIIYELYLQLLKFLQKLAPIRLINNTFK